jgi:hypothetical protein
VHDWRLKWFYIKDQKSSKSDLYSLAPFDALKSLKKLKSWDVLAGMMAPEKSWCLVECPARWEPQEEGMMNTAARFSLS